MSGTILRSEAVKSQFPASSWQAVLFSEFSATMLSQTRPYPCMFGVNGFKADQLRYVSSIRWMQAPLRRLSRNICRKREASGRIPR